MASSIRKIIVSLTVVAANCVIASSTLAADALILLNAEKTVSASLPSSDRGSIDSALPPLPLVIFIPGILGSKIEECDPGPINCTIIWGEVSASSLIFANQDLSYKPNKIYSTQPLFEFEAPINGTENVYGQGFSQIKESYVGADDIALGFSYDWRQGNEISAEKLQEYLCKTSGDKIKKRPIIFVAHSMGGLIFKYWYMECFKRKAICPSGVPLDLNISQIMFLGTPNYGAPKAIAAFANGNDLVHPQGIFGTLKGLIVNRALANALDRAGVHFQSGYELLPIYGSRCQPPLPRIEMASPVVTSTGGKIDLFQGHSWEQLGWPKAITDHREREAFYKNELQTRLDKAKAFLCGTAQFEAEGTTKVTYYYSNAFSTDKSYRLDRALPPGNSDEAIPVVPDAGQNGDGTVPRDIGMDWAEISMNRQNVDSKILDLSHQDMLNAQLFQTDLQTIFSFGDCTQRRNSVPIQRLRLSIAT